MIFINGFDFDGSDGLNDDFQDDIFENEFESEVDDLDMEGADIGLGFQEAFIIGGMIGGQAYEEALDEREQHDIKEDEI